jgi:DNA-binding LacI/PurR family transcriptional regulator
MAEPECLLMLIDMDRPPPTQRDLARRLGLAQSCVSMALRGSRRIAADTRARVKAAALAMGYLPDPALAALSKRRWSAPPPALSAYLGSRTMGRDRYLVAASARAAELGLRLWHLPRALAEDDEKTQRALDRRRVAGVIVGQVTLLEKPRRLAWERLRAVHCGLLTLPDSGDIVCPDLPAAVPTAWRRLRERGFRRVAAIMPTDHRYHSEQLLLGALLALASQVGGQQLRVWTGSHGEVRDAFRWLRRMRVDALLAYDDKVGDAARRAGLDLPFATLTDSTERPDIAGMRVPYAAVAGAAVDLVSERLRAPPGSPPQRRTHLIEMQWVDGASLRA